MKGCLLLAVSIACFGQTNRFEGRIIQQVIYVPESQPVLPADLKLPGILEPGQPFRASDAAATIDALFATGRFQDIQVDVEPVDDQVSVTVITESQMFVGHIDIQGDVGNSPTPTNMIEASRLRLGEPLYESDIEEATQRLSRLLTSNGLYEHTIRYEYQDLPDIQQRELFFIVDTGPRAKYEEPKITGNPKLSDRAITAATGWRWRLIHIWRKATQERTNKGLVGIQRKYQDEGWLMAEIGPSPMTYDPKSQRVQSTIDIQAGPKVEVQAIETEVSQKTLKKYVPIFQELAVDRDLLIAGADNLRDYFQSEGYLQAQVDFRERRPDAENLIVEYVITLGPRSKLVHVGLEGNTFFSDEDLRERMFLEESGLIRLRHGRFSRAFLESDQEAISNLYRANGFRDVEVSSDVEESYKGQAGEVGVTIQVDEGPFWTIRSLQFQGVDQLNPEEFRASLNSLEGQPYSERNVSLDRDTILTRYQIAGYPDAAFAWSSVPDEDLHQVDLIFRIDEGRRQTVRNVVLTGVDSTRLSLVEREITLKPGDPLSLVAMSSIQQRLYQLGVFSRIDMAVQNQGGSTASKYVLYDFHEASRYSLAVGGGAEFARIGGSTTDLSQPEGAAGLSPRLSLNLSRLNLLGLGHSIALRGRISRLEQVSSINYLAPRFRNVEGRNIMFTLQYQVSRDVRTFTSRRQEASIQISQQISKPSSLLLRYSYRRVSTANVVIPQLLIPQLLQPVRLGILSGNYVQDRRDNPANTTRGIYNTLDLGVAGSAFGSQRNFLRVLGRDATYHPFGRDVVLARETSFGVIFPFAIPAGSTAATTIPLPERFFGGGSATHRGFPENQAGPRDTGTRTSGPDAQATGFPLGGNALFFNKVELRFPLLGDNIGGVLFHDAGNVYSTLGDVSFRVHQRDDTDFNYMVHAAGFGIRYKTPVGPIRVDLAYSINPPRYRGFDGSRQDLLQCGPPGSATQCDPVSRRISHFQFFFSIGQTF